MCGITGFLKLSNAKSIGSASEEKNILERMNRALTHRGPDADGYLMDDPVMLAMRRLKIIDLESGDQPIFNEDKTVGLVFNGEIYNYLELRKELEGKGHRFQTQSDTETIVHLYEEMGEEFPKKLRGMFAFALWDFKKRRLILGRDPFGIKPMYWGIFGNQLIFGSEIKALTEHPLFEKRLNRAAIDDYMSLMFIPAPATAYEGLWKLEPGHLLICEANGRPRKYEYWSGLPERRSPHRSVEESLEALESKISECVKIALRSDVPLGVFLSSGVDSSLVSYFSKKHKADLRTFTVYFEDKSYSEREEAASVARALGTKHTEILMEMPRNPEEFSSKIFAQFDEPFGDTSALPTYLLCQAARKHVTVALSGEGGDELFAGYPTFIATSFFNWYRFMPKWLRAEVLPALVNGLPTSMSRVSFDYKMKRFFSQAGYHDDWREIHFAWRGAFSWQERQSMYMPEFFKEVAHRKPFESVLGHFKRVQEAPMLDQLMYADRMTYLADEFLVKGDRMSMAHSLEVRPPLLDHELAELAWKVPGEFKIRGFQTKWILRKLMEKKLPAEILRLPKKGFTPPLGRWFLDPHFQDFIRSSVNDSKMKEAGLVNPFYVERLIQEHAERRADHTRRLWVILGLALFTQRNAHVAV